MMEVHETNQYVSSEAAGTSIREGTVSDICSMRHLL